jgi:hypothetical protein
MKMTTMLAAALLAASLGACGDSEAQSGPTSTTTTGPAASAPTTTAETDTGMLETEMTSGLVYHQNDERFRDTSGLVDVIAPAEGESWPIVVAFHGDPRSVSKEWHRRDAEMLAERGRVVFLPAWGHLDGGWVLEHGTRAAWDLDVAQLACAVAFARAHAAEYGGDPDRITLYGLSAGGNATLMAGLAEAAPLDTCTVPGPAVIPDALVPIDADVVLGGGWDAQLEEDPEAFYSLTPWRHLDGSPDIPITVMVTEHCGMTRGVGSDPGNSWLALRHTDIDLAADVQRMGYLDDGDFGLREAGEYFHQKLVDAGYDADLVVVPGATHETWGEEGYEVVVETVLEAEDR